VTRRHRRALFGAIVVVLVSAAVPSCGRGDAASDGDGGPEGSASAATPRSALPADCPTTVPERLVPQVVRELAHSTDAFTEGLVVHDGILYESNGLEGRSSVRALDPDTGAVRRNVAVDPAVFAEGLAVGTDGQLVQLTWKDGRAYVRDAATLEELRRFEYRGEGWGLTTLDDGTLVMSDGSDQLVERDPEDFSRLRRWKVSRVGGAVDQLNELDWDGQHLWANRWQTDEIVRIDPRCRRVDAVVDASSLVASATAAARAGGTPIDVLNGIAHLPGTDRFLVTGKLWPVMYEVRFVPA